MSKYEVGDKVPIRKDLEVGERYKGCSLVESMKQYLGKEAIIEKVDYDGDYKIDLDDREWYWTDDMFDEVVNFTLVNALKFIKDGMSLVNEDGSKVITCKDGVVYTKGFNGEFDLEEVFYVAEVLTLIEVLNKKYVEKQITMYMENEGSRIVTLKDDLDIYDKYGIDVTECYYIKDLLGATFSIKL